MSTSYMHLQVNYSYSSLPLLLLLFDSSNRLNNSKIWRISAEKTHSRNIDSDTFYRELGGKIVVFS